MKRAQKILQAVLPMHNENPTAIVGTELSVSEKEIGVKLVVKGFRLLIKAPVLPDKTKGGIILTEQHKNFQRRTQNIGLVIDMGPTAFTGNCEDRKCEIGDWVSYSIMEREEVYPNDHLCYWINDERIYCVIPPDKLPAFIKEMR